MGPSAQPKIYHIAHVDGLPSIIGDGSLWCDQQIVAGAGAGTIIGMGRCGKAGHQIVDEYVDRVSGGKGKDKRTEFARMFDDAHKRQFQIVLCWALDRFSREGMVPTIGHLQRLAAAGVGFHSFTEPMLSTDNEMIRDIVLAVMASLAKQERLRHVERIHAGIAKARVEGTQSGKPIGRPWIDKRREAAIRAELAKGTGILKTARLCKVGTGTVQRIKREMKRAL